MTTYETCSSMAIPAEKECSECGDQATTELEDASGVVWPLCANCDVWWRESEAEREAMNGMCQDCSANPVTCRFVHLHKGVFYLCDECFGFADHEDDYLEYCDHAYPDVQAGQTHCNLCRRQPRDMFAEMCERLAPADVEHDFVDPGEQDDDFLAEESEEEDEDDIDDWECVWEDSE